MQSSIRDSYFDRSTTVTTATNSYTPASSTGFSAKVAGIAYAVAATLLAVGLRESLDAATTGDKTDATYTWGL
jgi:hypothetical protein